jgi:hypothetical protein
MSKMKDLSLTMEEAYFRGTPATVVAEDLGVSLDTVLDYYDQLDADEADREVSGCYDDSMDGDEASALASVGWGTDEDYGYAGDEW